MRRNFKSLTTLFLLMLSVQCQDSCRVSFEIINQTSHIIKIIAPEKEQILSGIDANKIPCDQLQFSVWQHECIEKGMREYF